jgi:hypothetical protein
MKIYRLLISSLILLGLLTAGAMAATSFCSRIEAGSSIDTGAVNIRTSASDLFTLATGSDPVELDYQILVTELQPGTPSRGTVSSYMNALIQEGNGDTPTLRELLDYRESSSVSGKISIFEKIMHYESGFFF